jgi:hypothetical protein
LDSHVGKLLLRECRGTLTNVGIPHGRDPRLSNVTFALLTLVSLTFSPPQFLGVSLYTISLALIPFLTEGGTHPKILTPIHTVAVR